MNRTYACPHCGKPNMLLREELEAGRLCSPCADDEDVDLAHMAAALKAKADERAAIDRLDAYTREVRHAL